MRDCNLDYCDHFIKIMASPKLGITHTWVGGCGAETISVVYDMKSEITCGAFTFHRSEKDGKSGERE